MEEGTRRVDDRGGSVARHAGRVAADCVAVVPAYMAEQTLAATLESLTVANREAVRRVVVVASPGDRSADIAAKLPGVDVVRTSSRVSAGYARNLGRRALRREPYVLFLDADCRLASGAVRTLLEACERDGLAAAGAAIVSSSSAVVAWTRHLLEFKDSEPGVRSGWPWMLPSAALMCRTDAFDRVGGFPDMWPGEDLVFCEKLRALGLTVQRIDSTCATHAHPPGIACMISHQYRLGATSAVARRQTGMRGVGFVDRLWAIPALFAGRLLRSVFWIVRERPQDAGRFLVRFPLVVAGLAAWTIGFARGAMGSRSGNRGGGEWRWV